LTGFAVCWFHFTHGNPEFLPDGYLKSSGALGWLGVEIFFVISGFIIPYSLHNGGYQIANFFKFFIKRIIRLDPPYLISIFLVLALGFASASTPGFRGPPFEPSLAQVLLHLGYVNVLFGYPWLSPVFWTLAIEFQYYILIGLLFPAIAHRSAVVRTLIFSSFAWLALVFPENQFLFHWIFLFMLGMAAFQLRVGIVERRQFIFWVALLGFGAWHVGGIPIAITGIATSLLLGLVDAKMSKEMLFFGQISYSLYLLHVPIGMKVINISLRFVHSIAGKVAVLAAALTLTIAVAWLFYKYVERPAQQWSSSMRYRGK
jgi:peptidoglycan/LPS O-acetylase OafA/YrhL